MAGYGPPTDNRIFTDGTWNYGYDAEGNMISAIRISNGDNWAFGYDNANEMTSVVHKDGSGNVLMTAAYTYDVFGHRLEKSDTLNRGATPSTYITLTGPTLL